MPHALADRGRFPPWQRVEMEHLAGGAPAGLGLEMTHWSTRSLARVAVGRGIVPRMAHWTVSLILRSASWQPHRWRYGKTPTLTEEFPERAARIVWLYERVVWLPQPDEGIVALDEKPNIEVLQRRSPTRLMPPGRMECQELEDSRHGTVNVLLAWVVHSGQRRGWCLPANDRQPWCRVLPQLFDEHGHARRLHLIGDGGPSHTSALTRQCVGE